MGDRWRVGAWAAVGALYLLVHLPLLDLPLERDEGAFAAVGEAILDGAVPYRDVFDHKPAGVHYAYAAALLVVPPTTRGLHAFLLVWNFATLLAVAGAAALLSRAAAAPWAAALFAVLSASPAVQGFSASSEMLLLLPLSASLWLALRAARSTSPATRFLQAALAGGLAAAACWFKPPALLPALGGVLVLVARRGAGGWRAARRDVAAFAAGALVVGGVPLLALLGAGAEPWYWLIEHNRLYAALAPTDWASRAMLRWQEAHWDLGPALLIAVAGLFWAIWRRQPGAPLALAWLLLSCAAVPHSPFLYRHYLALAVPALAAAGALAIDAIGFANAPLRRVAQVAVLAVALLPGVIAKPWYWNGADPLIVDEQLFGAQGFAAAQLVADYLRTHSAPDEGVFVFGSEPQIPFLAGRRDPNPYRLVYPLTGDWPRAREFQQRAWAAVEAAAPRYLVIARAPASLMLSPRRDRFFETQLIAYAAGYEREQLLVHGPAGYALLPATQPPPADADLLFELWARRAPPAAGAP